MPVQRITSLDLPGLQVYRTLRRPVDHQKQGIFVAEGEKVVRRLLESSLEVLSILLTDEWLSTLTGLISRRKTEPELFVAPKELVETIVGFPLHQGIMAVGRIPHLSSAEAFISNLPKKVFLAAVDGLTNSENLGVLVRNCAAFGVDGLIVGETSSSPYLRRAVRNSMGTVFNLPVLPTSHLAATLQELNSRGVVTVAAHPHARQPVQSLEDVGSSVCVVFGSEGEGISPEVLSACTHQAAIPMKEGVDSLNVASASAVILFALQNRLRR